MYEKRGPLSPPFGGTSPRRGGIGTVYPISPKGGSCKTLRLKGRCECMALMGDLVRHRGQSQTGEESGGHMDLNSQLSNLNS